MIFNFWFLEIVVKSNYLIVLICKLNKFILNILNIV